MFVFRTSRQVIKSVLRTKRSAPLLRTFCDKEIEEALDQAEADRFGDILDLTTTFELIFSNVISHIKNYILRYFYHRRHKIS